MTFISHGSCNSSQWRSDLFWLNVNERDSICHWSRRSGKGVPSLVTAARGVQQAAEQTLGTAAAAASHPGHFRTGGRRHLSEENPAVYFQFTSVGAFEVLSRVTLHETWRLIFSYSLTNSDVRIKLDDQTIAPGHRFVLNARSDHWLKDGQTWENTSELGIYLNTNLWL